MYTINLKYQRNDVAPIEIKIDSKENAKKFIELIKDNNHEIFNNSTISWELSGYEDYTEHEELISYFLNR